MSSAFWKSIKLNGFKGHHQNASGVALCWAPRGVRCFLNTFKLRVMCTTMGGPPSMKNRSKMNEDTFARQDTVSWKNPCDEFVSSVDGEKQTVLSLAGDASLDGFDGVKCENAMSVDLPTYFLAKHTESCIHFYMLCFILCWLVRRNQVQDRSTNTRFTSADNLPHIANKLKRSFEPKTVKCKLIIDTKGTFITYLSLY